MTVTETSQVSPEGHLPSWFHGNALDASVPHGMDAFKESFSSIVKGLGRNMLRTLSFQHLPDEPFARGDHVENHPEVQ